MVTLVVSAVVLLVGAVLVARRRRKVLLAGLNPERPTFSVEPAHRRVSRRKHEAL